MDRPPEVDPQQALPGAQRPQAARAAADPGGMGQCLGELDSRALRDANLTVPDDIALIGFDDLPQAASMSPPLTTLRQPMAAVGRSLVETLLDIIAHGPMPPRQLVFGQELVVRGSCGAVRG